MENVQRLKKKPCSGNAIQKKMLFWERKAFGEGASLIIGVDEAGRGPLAGPVVAAAVVLRPLPLKRRLILPRYRERLDDSKKLSIVQREKSFSEISKKSLFGVGLKHHNFIDKKNIHRATFLAMRQAVANLIDTNRDVAIDTSNVFIAEMYADEGPTMKRFKPRAQGRATRIRKRTSHIFIKVSTKE